ncbi:MAG TPA: thioredoxin [Spirochaetia bacterium]|nr:thioredoxin [Spirochaetia bacterium]
MVDKHSVLTISDESFDKVISEGVTIVDFWAEWCMPCRMQAPIMDKVAEKMGERVVISKINVDENPNTAVKFGITGIPTSILFKDGKEAQRFVGVQSEAALMRAIESNL